MKKKRATAKKKRVRTKAAQKRRAAAKLKRAKASDRFLPVPDSPAPRPGQKLSEDNWAIVEEMASSLCSIDEIAAYLGCGRVTLTSPPNEARFRETMGRKGALTKYQLRKRQLTEGLDSHNTVARIWLGKQYLNQADKQEVSSAQAERFLAAGADALEKLGEALKLAGKVREAKKLEP